VPPTIEYHERAIASGEAGFEGEQWGDATVTTLGGTFGRSLHLPTRVGVSLGLGAWYHWQSLDLVPACVPGYPCAGAPPLSRLETLSGGLLVSLRYPVLARVDLETTC
jgi:hypothetical protein